MKIMSITGLGALTPIETEKNSLWDTLINDTADIKSKTKDLSAEKSYHGEIRSINFKDYVKDKRVKRAAKISKYALIAISMAKNDAGFSSLEGDKTGIVFSLTHGAMNYTQEIHKSLLTEKEALMSPALFSDSVLNAPAGNAAIAFGIKGPIHTLIGGPPTPIKAIILASQMLTSGAIEKSIVVSSEELNELICQCYTKLGIDRLAEGSAALVLELQNSQNDSKAYAHVSGIASHFEPTNKKNAATNVIKKCLKMANIRKEDIGLIMTDSSLQVFEEYFDGIPIGGSSQLTGNAFALTTLLNIVISALILKKEKIPHSIIRKNYSKSRGSVNIKNILIYASEIEGRVSSIILSKP